MADVWPSFSTQNSLFHIANSFEYQHETSDRCRARSEEQCTPNRVPLHIKQFSIVVILILICSHLILIVITTTFCTSVTTQLWQHRRYDMSNNLQQENTTGSKIDHNGPSSSNFISRRIQYDTFHTHNISTISQMYSSGGCQRSSVAHRADNLMLQN